MRLPKRSKPSRPKLGARLARVKEATPAPATPPARRRYLLVGSLVAVALLIVTAAVALGRLNSPPRAAIRQRHPNGLEFRVVAVTRGPQHRFVYAPPRSALRGALARLGWKLGDTAVQQTLDVPPEAVTIWLWISRPRLPLADSRVTDESQRIYRNGAEVSPLVVGRADWGRATLGWVSLTTFDRTAQRLGFEVPVPGTNQALPFNVPGPAEPPAPWQVGERYPLLAGDQTADLRLWQLRGVDPPTLASLGALGQVTTPPQELLLADLDVADRGSTAAPGLWEVTVNEARTNHGERLTVVHQQAGLVWLTSGRRPDGFGAVKLQVRARKRVSDRQVVVFRSLDLPREPGTPKRWSVAGSAPFPGAEFELREGVLVKPGLLRLTIEARAPAETAIYSLRFADALDDQGRRFGPVNDPNAHLLEQRSGPAGVFWRWSIDLATPANGKRAALAFRAVYQRTSATTRAELIGRLQPAPSGRVATLGLLLQPRTAAPGQRRRFVIGAIVAGSRAAASPLRLGDEVVSLDGLSPELLPRLLTRHQPGDNVTVRYRRGGQPAETKVRLDAAR